MNFEAYLTKLRAKPDHKKKQFAFWSSFGFTAIVFVFWIATFGSATTISDSLLSKAVENVGTPAQSLVASVGSVFDSVKNYFFGPKVVQYSELEVLPGK